MTFEMVRATTQLQPRNRDIDMTRVEEAHRVAARTSVSDIAGELQEILGQRQVAFAVQIKSSKEVSRWAADESKPRDETDARLRRLYRVVEVLRKGGEDRETIRAWMLGSDPVLEEQAPIEAFRDGRWVDVLRAAESFIGQLDVVAGRMERADSDRRPPGALSPAEPRRSEARTETLAQDH